MKHWTDLENLVLVAGHAIPRRFDNLTDDASWFLKHFQAGEGPYYVQHVRAGVELAAADPRALLVFAGGQTDSAAGPRTEAQGYWLIAEHHGWYGMADVATRATTEEFSLDSMLNLLYGICRFRECTSRYPHHITVAGWAFKGPRFDFHRHALRFPAERFRYAGVNDPDNLNVNLPFELQRLQDFRLDPYGASPNLAAKREARNPFRRFHGYAHTCPELRNLLAHAGPELYEETLPWSG